MVNISDYNLTQKQKIFCEEYIIDWNATRAAKKAGYSEKTAYSIGIENLKKPEIQSYIKAIQEDLEKIAGISRLKVLNEHSKIAFSSIASIHDSWIDRKEFESLTDEQKSCISEIDTKILKKNIGTNEEPEIVDVEFVKIKLFDKQKSLDAISKMLGYNEAEEINHSGDIIITRRLIK